MRVTDLDVLTDVELTDHFLVESAEHGTGLFPISGLTAGVYDGQDLEVLFADEIAEYDSVWAWIAARCADRNYAGLRPKDYIKWTLNGYTIVSQIAGLEPYINATDVALAGHIDFISRNCYPEYVRWNTSNVNQGDSTNAAPYMISNLKAWYDELADDLPTELSAVILNKRSLMETRYTSGSTLTESTSWAWNDLGKLWAPHETEVHGYRNMSGQRTGGNPVHYDLFKDGRSHVKYFGEGSTSRVGWWECDVMSGSSTDACHVSANGVAATVGASAATVAAVLGFRIGYEA